MSSAQDPPDSGADREFVDPDVRWVDYSEMDSQSTDSDDTMHDTQQPRGTEGGQ